MKQSLDITLLNPRRVKELKQEIKDLEGMYHADQASGSPKIGDRQEFFKDINKRKKELKDFAPKEFKGEARNRAYSELKKLRNFIKRQMPKSNMYFQKQIRNSDGHSKYQDFESTVQQQMHFQQDPNCVKAVRRYKNIAARLDPHDPTINNIELLRE